MDSTSVNNADARRYLMAFVAQLALVALAVLVRQTPGTMVVVLGVGMLNAALVLVVMMDARRGPWMLQVLVVLVLVMAAAILLWPTWDLLERARLS